MTSTSFPNDDLLTLELIGNTELQKLSEWLNAKKLTLNVKKSNYVIYRSRQEIKPFYSSQTKIFYSISNTRVTFEMKDFVTYLGVMIDSELSWKHSLFT